MKDVFDSTPSTGDPVKDKILADNVQILRAMDVWSVTGDFKTPGVATYLNPAMYVAYGPRTEQYHAAGKIPAGIARFYDRRVITVSGTRAEVIACEDGRRGYDEIAKTGQKVPNSSDGISAIIVMEVKDSDGVWQAESYSKLRNSSLCSAP